MKVHPHHLGAALFGFVAVCSPAAADTIEEFLLGRDFWRLQSALGTVTVENENDALNNLWARWIRQNQVIGSGPLIDGIAFSTIVDPGQIISLTHTHFDGDILESLFDPVTLDAVAALDLYSLDMGNFGIPAGAYASAQVGNVVGGLTVLSVDYYWSDRPFDDTPSQPGDVINPANFNFIGSSNSFGSFFDVFFEIPLDLDSDMIDIRCIVNYSDGSFGEGFAAMIVTPLPSAAMSGGVCLGWIAIAGRRRRLGRIG